MKNFFSFFIIFKIICNFIAAFHSSIHSWPLKIVYCSKRDKSRIFHLLLFLLLVAQLHFAQGPCNNCWKHGKSCNKVENFYFLIVRQTIKKFQSSNKFNCIFIIILKCECKRNLWRVCHILVQPQITHNSKITSFAIILFRCIVVTLQLQCF